MLFIHQLMKGGFTSSQGVIEIRGEDLQVPPPHAWGHPSLQMTCILALEREVIWAEYTQSSYSSGSSSLTHTLYPSLFPSMSIQDGSNLMLDGKKKLGSNTARTGDRVSAGT